MDAFATASVALTFEKYDRVINIGASEYFASFIKIV